MDHEARSALATHHDRRQLVQDGLGRLERPAALTDSLVPPCQQDRLLTGLPVRPSQTLEPFLTESPCFPRDRPPPVLPHDTQHWLNVTFPLLRKPHQHSEPV